MAPGKKQRAGGAVDVRQLLERAVRTPRGLVRALVIGEAAGERVRWPQAGPVRAARSQPPPRKR
jgi:hypothetical protein